MKKLLSILLVLTIISISLFGCGGNPKHFTGEWKFAEVIKVEFIPDELSDDMINYLKEIYGADTEEGILTNAHARFIEEQTFANYYLKFDKKYTYTYDPFMDREATWFFYQTSETEGFISFDGYLNAEDGNPAPSVYPNISYHADDNTMYIVENNSSSFMITLKLTR